MQRGLQSLKLDSHHLRGSRCSNWAPRTLGPRYLEILLKMPECNSTLGIELLLLPVSGKFDCFSWTKRSHNLRDICLHQFYSERLLVYCPGNGGIVALAVNLTSFHVRHPSSARRGMWIGEAALGLRTFCDTLLREAFSASACRPSPCRGNYGQFHFLDFL